MDQDILDVSHRNVSFCPTHDENIQKVTLVSSNSCCETFEFEIDNSPMKLVYNQKNQENRPKAVPVNQRT